MALSFEIYDLDHTIYDVEVRNADRSDLPFLIDPQSSPGSIGQLQWLMRLRDQGILFSSFSGTQSQNLCILIP